MEELNYLFIGPDNDDYKIMYKDFEEPEKGSYACFVSLSDSIKSCMKTIKMIEIAEKHREKLCIIVSARIYEKLGSILSTFLKYHYEYAIFLLYLVDVVPAYQFAIEQAKEEFDLVFSYDEMDAETFGLYFCQEPFSMYKIEPLEEKYDLSYIGSAKNRLEKILKLYEKAKEHGLKCDFYIYGVPKAEQRYYDEIHYNSFLTFEELLKHVVQSRCLLEVLEKDMYSPTTRFAEAVLYKKKLLSDSPKFRQNLKYSNVTYFQDIDSIDWRTLIKKEEFILGDSCEIFAIEHMKETIKERIQAVYDKNYFSRGGRMA